MYKLKILYYPVRCVRNFLGLKLESQCYLIKFQKFHFIKLQFAIDIAEFGGKKYLVVVDYYSRWIEVLKLYNKTSDVVIDVLKELFSRLGVPKQLVAYNMPFISYKFIEFSSDYVKSTLCTK